MACLIEKKLPFSYCAGADNSVDISIVSNDLVFALLECLADGVNIRRQQDMATDTERLEHKLNLVIFMMNSLLQPMQMRPASVTLRLDTESIAWQTSTEFEPRSTVHIEIYLHPMIPLPLRCPVRILECQHGWCHAQLHALSDEALSSWSRWVFREHRHVIALSREHTGLSPIDTTVDR